MLKKIFDELLTINNRYVQALGLIPCSEFGLNEYCEKLIEKTLSVRSWRSRILLLEALLLSRKITLFERLLDQYLSELKKNISASNFKINAFIIPYLISINKKDGYDLFSNTVNFIQDKLSLNKMDYLDFMEFWEIFMRYSLFFKINIINIFDDLLRLFDAIGKREDFYDILSFYFRYSNIIVPPEDTVLEVYKRVFSSIDLKDLIYTRFLSSFLLSYIKIDRDKGLSLLNELIRNFDKPVNALSLYKSIKNIRAYAVLIYALTHMETENEFLNRLQRLLDLIEEYIKHLRWKIDEWRNSGYVSIDDLDVFIEELSEVTSEELIGAKELSEDLSYYFDTLINLLEDALEAAISSALNSIILKRKQLESNIINRIKDLIEHNNIFTVSYKAYIYPYLWLVSKDNKCFETGLKFIKKFCNRWSREECRELIELIGEFIGKAYYIYRDSTIIQLLFSLYGREKFFKKSMNFIKGFISGLYSLSSLMAFKKFKK